MQRLRLQDFKLSRGPVSIGLCADDTPGCAAVVNAAQERLLTCLENSDDGWYGGWAEIAFPVSPLVPYITTPREVARMELVTVCDRAVPVENQFFSYQQFGTGKLPRTACTRRGCRPVRVISQNNVPSFVDLSTPPQYLVAYPTDPADATGTSRVLFQGRDQNDNIIYSITGTPPVQVLGQYVTLASPFSATPMTFNTLTGVQKDVTVGQVNIFQMDPNTGAQVQILTMQPGETTADYRRYYLDSLPGSCCNTPGIGTVNVSAIVKLDLIPCVVDSDWLLIQSLEALIEECQSIRYMSIDLPTSAQLAAMHHTNAVRYLKGQLKHFLGLDEIAVNSAIFGSARLSRAGIGVVT